MLIVISLFLFVATTLYVLYLLKYGRRIYLFSRIPSPKKKFLFHNALEFLNITLEDLFKKFQRWHDEHGLIYHISVHPFDCGVFFVGDAKIAEALSLHQPDRSRSKTYVAVSRWIGADGFLLSPVDQIKSKMKPVMGGLSPKFYERVTNSLFN